MKGKKFVSWQVRLVVGLLLTKVAFGVYATGTVAQATSWVSDGLNSVSVSLGMTEGTSEREAVPDGFVAAPSAAVEISTLGTPYTENFDGLGASGTPSTMPSGWEFNEVGGSTTTTYAADDGTANSGNTYSYGASGSSERALGMLRSGTVNSTIGASYKNTSGSTVSAITISFTGEQWRLGATPTPLRNDKIEFAYSTDATSLSTGTWTTNSNLNFVAPQGSASPVPTVGKLNGNLAANRTSVSYTITGLSIANNSIVYIRWTDSDASSSDDGLAVDDFSITAYAIPETTITSSPASTSGDSVAFSFTSDDSAATFECSLDGSSYATCGSPYNISSLADGSHTFNVRAKNPAGVDATPASYTWTVSTGGTPVPDTTITVDPGSPSNSSSATFEFTSDISGATFECKLDSGSYESCTSPQSYTSLSDGSHTFTVRATASSQTDASPASYTWTVDATAPETSISTTLPVATYKTSASIAFSGTDTGGSGVASYECKLDSGSYAACTTPVSYSGLSTGSHTVNIRAIDSAGNTDASPAQITWSVGTGAFTGGNIAALVVASNSASNTTGEIVELNKTTAGQVGVQLIEIPGSGSSPMRLSGSSTANAYLSRSNDGSLLLFTGHNSTDSATAVTGISARGVGAFTSGGVFSIAATYTNSSSAQTRSATTLDNTNFFIADASGLFTNSASAASPSGSYRGAKAFGGVVYLGISSTTSAPVGTVSAITGGTFTGLTGLSNTPSGTTANDFYFVSSGENGPIWDVLYLVSTTSATAGTISKYSLVSGTWTANGTYTTSFGGYGLAAEDFGTGARLYVSTGSGATAANSVIRLTDTTGYNSTISITTADNVTLYTAASGTAIKGVTLAPQSGLNSAPVITAASGVARTAGGTSSNSNIATVGDLDTGAGSVTVTVTSANPSDGVTISNIQNTNGTVTADIVADCGTATASFTLQASDGTATSTASFTVTVNDNTAPTLAYGNASVAATGSTTINPTSGPSDDGSVVSVAIQSQGTFTGTISVDSAGVISVSDAGPAGSHTITVRATDNCGAATNATFTLLVSNTTPPTTDITSAPAATSNSASASFAFTSDATGAVFECRLDSGSYGACTSPKAYTGLAEGSHTFYVRAKDTDGVYDPTPASHTWTVDTVAPETTLSAQPASTTISGTARFEFSSADLSATFECQLDSGSYSACTSPKEYTGLANGSHTFSVRAVDAASNTDATPSTASWSVVKPSAFSAGNLVVFRVGAVASNTTGTLVELDTTTAAQSALQSIGLDGSGSLSLRFSGSATSSGYLSRSNDGSRLFVTGHSSTVTASNANTLLTRAVAAFNSVGDFSMPTTYTGASGNQTRSATTVNGSNFFITDTGGLYTNGATLADPVGSFRAAKAFGGTVYVGSTSATHSPVVTIGSTTGGTVTSLPGLSNAAGSETDFYLISSGENGPIYDVLYISSASNATTGTVSKYSLVDGSWVANGSYATTFGGFSLVAEDSGSGAHIYMTTGSGATSTNSVIKLSDTTGHNQTIAVTTADNVTLYTAPSGTNLKGVAFAPADWVNTPPSITASSVTKAKGSTATSATIATVGDLDTGAGSVTVSVVGSATSNGVTISNIQRSGSTVTADIATSCSATSASFTLQANDGTGTSNATLSVTVSANTAPTLSYANAAAADGGSATINPATGPTDNGTIATIAIQSQGTYTGTISVNSSGVVSVSNAGPMGVHTIVVRATDGCGLTTDASFTLTVADTVPPETSISSSPSSITNSTSAAFGFSASEAGSSFECSLDSGAWGSCTSPKNYTGLSAGTHVFEVRATDAIGNTDTSPASYSWTVDLTNPTVTPFEALSNTGSTQARTLTVEAQDANGIGDVSVVYSVSSTPPVADEPALFGSASAASCSQVSGTQYQCTIPGVSFGSAVSYFVRATDSAGNQTDFPNASAPMVYTVGRAVIPGGTYTSLSLDWFSELSADVTVTGQVSIFGEVNLGGHTLTLGCGATVSGAGSSSFFIGSLAKQFCGAGTFTFPVGAAILPVLDEGYDPLAPESVSIYSPVVANITAGTFPSTLTATAEGLPIGGSVPGQTLKKLWNVTETGDITADLTFYYLDGDVQGDESLYQVIRRSGGVSHGYVGGTVNAANNTFTAPNVFEFSQWSAGMLLVPTAAGADIEGRAISGRGDGLKNVTVMISGGNLTEPLVTKTNQFGTYRFTGLETGATYVMQVMSGRHTFRNASKVIVLYESLTEENFVADPR